MHKVAAYYKSNIRKLGDRDIVGISEQTIYLTFIPLSQMYVPGRQH